MATPYLLFQRHSNFEEYSKENDINQGISPSTARKSLVIPDTHTHTKRPFRTKKYFEYFSQRFKILMLLLLNTLGAKRKIFFC